MGIAVILHVEGETVVSPLFRHELNVVLTAVTDQCTVGMRGLRRAAIMAKTTWRYSARLMPRPKSLNHRSRMPPVHRSGFLVAWVGTGSPFALGGSRLTHPWRSHLRPVPQDQPPFGTTVACQFSGTERPP